MRHAALLELDPSLQDRAAAELRGGERLVWAGQPTFRWASAGVIIPMVFAIPFTAIALVWVVGAWFVTRVGGDAGLATFFPFCGVPFVLVGLALFTTPVWAKRTMRRTVYLVTDRRAIVLSELPMVGLRSRSFEPAQVARMERTERRDGSGDLVFEVFTERRGTSVSTTRHGFFNLPRVREVEDLLRRTLLEGHAR